METDSLAPLSNRGQGTVGDQVHSFAKTARMALLHDKSAMNDI
eukprot:CAMPEP_0171893074 /NCGR_PEP_ID=MMETSP0992-20121227/45674_1 /TAXON_ID=483369 /ORGANISM="non described non described, Strain CCMP2098" /LENGTH=42 /DNA_ID= /DNA_START= /DNA_END= /DNA_ORIENTATION=